MRKLAISIALAGLFVTAGPANAAVAINTLPIGLQGISFSHVVSEDPTFNDVYYFQLTSTSNLSGVLTNKSFSIPTLGSVDTAGLSASLYWDSGASSIAALTTPIGTFGLSPASFSGLAAGIYHVSISGTVSGTLAGAYTLGLSNAPAVPEPESYAMLLAGLGLMGAIVRRRSMKRHS